MISPAHNDLLAKYLRAWQTYDTNAVREIFDTSSTYSIEGKRTLQGLDEICGYWDRNKKRQHNLKIFPPLELNSERDTSSFIFCANFVDLEENENQTVYGRITLRHPGDKIAELTEVYLLDRLPLHPPSQTLASSGARSIPPLISRAYWWIKNQAKNIAEFLLTRATTFFIALMAVLLGYSAVKLNELPDVLLEALAFRLPATIPLLAAERELLTATAYRHLSTFASLFVFGVLFITWLRYRVRQPIKITNLQAEGHDLSIMKTRFERARELLIFAGDFDFIKNDEKLRQTFRRLHAQNGLTLVSDKSEQRVREGFGNSPDAIFLFEGLKQNRQIHFSREPSIRCSIVRGWLGSEVIYRYEGGNADSFNNLHLCIMEGRKEARPLMDLLEKLAKPA